MNARENFYSSVFEVINSYKKREPEHSYARGFLTDHMLETGVFAATLLVAVFSGFAFVYPHYMKFESPVIRVPASQIAVTSPKESYAQEVSTEPLFLQLVPVADAYVSAGSPRNNYGEAQTLRAQARPAMQAIVSYTVPASDQFSRATLVLPGLTQGSAELDVFVSNEFIWDESSFTNSDVPTEGFSLVKSVSEITEESRIDVTEYVVGNTSLTVLLRAKSGSATYASSESTSGTPITLILE